MWSVGVSVLNDRLTANSGEGQRIYLRENIHLTKSGNLSFQPYWLDLNYKPELKYWGSRPFNKGSNNSFIGTMVSTEIWEFGGTSSVFFFLNRELKDNFALQAAIAESGITLNRDALEPVKAAEHSDILIPTFSVATPSCFVRGRERQIDAGLHDFYWLSSSYSCCNQGH